ncbi:MAG: class I SAM-dependent methyltransferase [Burkholderiales bacterium]|jgi:SAM-dependent methyltransferase
MTDLENVKRQQQQTWSKGDFAVIGWNTVFPGELLCEAVDLRAGHKVLDVAAGAGNVAISAARRNCEAVGIDYVPELIARARRRAESENLPVQFEVGDCEQIPFADESYDRVLSLYGSMFAPNQEKAANELIRVCRRGGKIGMGNWTPEGFWGQTFGLFARYVPPPEGVLPPPLWGTEQRLNELFGGKTGSMRFNTRSALFRFHSNQHWIDVFSRWFGPIIRVRETLDEAQEKRFLGELDDILSAFNRSGDNTLMVSADYLEVVIEK